MEIENKSFESTVFWKVADRTQSIKSESDKPDWPPMKSVIDSFVDDKVWSTKEACKNSIRGYTTKYNSYHDKSLRITKDNSDKIRKLDIDTYKQNHSWLGDSYLNKQTWKYEFNRGSFKAYKCRMFVLPEDKIADNVENYEEYCIKCDLIGKNERMSEVDFKIYKY